MRKFTEIFDRHCSETNIEMLNKHIFDAIQTINGLVSDDVETWGDSTPFYKQYDLNLASNHLKFQLITFCLDATLNSHGNIYYNKI